MSDPFESITPVEKHDPHDIVSHMGRIVTAYKKHIEREDKLRKSECRQVPFWLLRMPVPDDVELTQFNIWKYAYMAGYTWVDTDGNEYKWEKEMIL